MCNSVIIFEFQKSSGPGSKKVDTTAQEREAQKEYERIKKQKQRASETPQQREARLQKMREYSARSHSTFKLNATAEEKQAHKEYERVKKKQQRANETPQQREVRLQKMKEYEGRITEEYNASTSSTEKCKERSKYSYTKEYDMKQKRIQRERETPEQREERLQKAREYKETYTPKAGPKEKEASKLRVAAWRADRSQEQIDKDREAAREGMVKVRGRKTVDERNEEKDKQRLRRMGEPNWRIREGRRNGDKAGEEWDCKLASGKWRQGEKYYGHLEAIDPDNLEWDCPAGPDCTCHRPSYCSKCRREYYGCQALCPGKRCREWREQETDEPNPGTSGELYAPTVDIPEDMCEYDQIRQKNIEDRQRKFRELGLKEAKTKLK